MTKSYHEIGSGLSHGSDCSFWQATDALVASAEVVVDRPRGSPHPRDSRYIYPLDYGYLAGTTSGDGAGIDVWIGSIWDRRVTGLVCTVDGIKRDLEAKILLGCSPADVEQIQVFFTNMQLGHVVVPRQSGTST